MQNSKRFQVVTWMFIVVLAALASVLAGCDEEVYFYYDHFVPSYYHDTFYEVVDVYYYDNDCYYDPYYCKKVKK